MKIGLIACGLLLIVGPLTEAADGADAPPDLSGIWKISAPITALHTVDGSLPPLRVEALKVYEQHIAARAAGDLSWDGTTQCKPPGEPRTLFENSWPFQIGQSGQQVLFLFQWNRLVRVVEMGLKLPDFIGPFYFGKSSGEWQADTLVVHVIGVRADVMLDAAGLPHSEDMKLEERFQLINGGDTLQATVLVNDPKTYTRLWTTVLIFDRQPDMKIPEDNCLDRVALPLSYRPTLPEDK